MLRKAILFWAVLGLFLSTASAQQQGVNVTVNPATTEQGKNSAGKALKIILRKAEINTGKLIFGIDHRVSIDPPPSEALMEEGYIGMPLPNYVNWYGYGFLYITVNGKDINLAPIKSFRASEQGQRGVLEMSWESGDTTVNVKFLALPDDDKLFAEISATSKRQTPALQIVLRCYPSAFYEDPARERAVFTPTAVIEKGNPADNISPGANWYLLYGDKLLSGINGKPGGCGLLFLPEEIKSAEVSVTDGPISTFLIPTGTRVHLVFWDFPKGMTNDKARDYLKTIAQPTREQLGKMDFASRYLSDSTWKKEKEEILSLLKGLPGDSQEPREAQALVTEIETLQQTNKGGKSDLEDKLTDFMQKREKMKWELKFLQLKREQ